MKKSILKAILTLVLVLALACPAAFAETAPAETETVWTTKLTARFATLEEGQQLMRDRTLFHEQITDKTLAFFMQKKGGTLEEYIDYSAEQVQAFTPDEEQRIIDTLAWLQEQLEKHGLKLPDPGPITFVKSTGEEARGAAGYTNEGTVFLAWFVYHEEYYKDEMLHQVVVHEISHCLSRLFPEYRDALYSIVHFTVLDKDIEIPEEIREQIVANPDVEHHNSYATFTIGGEKKDCYLVFLTDSVFEKPGDTFFSGMYSGIVPLDDPKIHRVDEVEDFWDVVGRNTDYVEDPEELMATNVSYALTHLDTGFGEYKNPEILEKIVEYLKK